MSVIETPRHSAACDRPLVVRSPAPPAPAALLSPLTLMGTLASHRELITSFAARELLERHKGALLGVGWNIASPLLQLGIYTAVFGYLFGTRWERGSPPPPPHVDFPVVFFVGHTFFHVFAEMLGRAPTLVSGRPNLVRKVVFPLEILPVTILVSSLVYLLVAIVLSLGVLVLAGGSVPPSAVLAPLMLVPLVMLSLGAGWMLAAAGVFLRDVRHIVLVLTQLLMFCTPIFYRLDRIPESEVGRWIAFVIGLNPLTIIVENARRALLWGEPLEWFKLGVVTVISAVVMQLGYAAFMSARRHMADMH